MIYLVFDQYWFCIKFFPQHFLWVVIYLLFSNLDFIFSFAILPLCPSRVFLAKLIMIHILALYASSCPVNESHGFRYICKHVWMISITSWTTPRHNSNLKNDIQYNLWSRIWDVGISCSKILCYVRTCIYLSASLISGQTRGPPPSPVHVPAKLPLKQLKLLCNFQSSESISWYELSQSVESILFIGAIFRVFEKLPSVPKCKQLRCIPTVNSYVSYET